MAGATARASERRGSSRDGAPSPGWSSSPGVRRSMTSSGGGPARHAVRPGDGAGRLRARAARWGRGGPDVRHCARAQRRADRERAVAAAGRRAALDAGGDDHARRPAGLGAATGRGCHDVPARMHPRSRRSGSGPRVEPRRTVLGAELQCLLVTPARRPLRRSRRERVPLALVAWPGLGPRPVPDHPAIRLTPGAMAVLIGRGQAHGHDLEPDMAPGSSAGSTRASATGPSPCQRGWRRNLEVLEGDGGHLARAAGRRAGRARADLHHGRRARADRALATARRRASRPAAP